MLHFLPEKNSFLCSESKSVCIIHQHTLVVFVYARNGKEMLLTGEIFVVHGYISGRCLYTHRANTRELRTRAIIRIARNPATGYDEAQ